MKSSKLPSLLVVAGAIVFSPTFATAQPAVKLPAATDLRSHGVTQDQIESLSETMSQFVEQQKVAGCSFLISHKGETVFREAVGYADIKSKRSFTTDELLPIASVSKPLLASVLMVLVEQEKLELDDPVEKYLPEFKGIKVEGSQLPAQMTIRHLLSHTAGFWGNKGITPEKMDLIRNFKRPLAEAVKSMAEYDLLYEPGTKWVYSGAGYCVAGRVAEVALGQSLEEIAQEALFRPLGMTNTTFLPSKETRKTVPSGYVRQDGKLREQRSIAEVEDLRFILPGGSLFTTLDELAAFGQMHLNDGLYNGKRILSETSVTEMRRLQSPGRASRTYGLGWFRGDISESGLADQVFHGGALGAHFRIDRRREVVCVFLVHQTAVQVQDLKNKLVEQVNGMFPVPKSLPDGPFQAKRQLLPHLTDEDLRTIRNSADKPSVKDADLLKAVLTYLKNTNSPKFRKAAGKRPYIATVIAAQNRAGRELPNVSTIYPGDLPRIGGGNNHINAEGQIKLGKITASAVEEFYQAKE